MVSKTRDRLIEVAKQLFAHKGVENTTMNDIAAASDKGRRTVYTYFKNKREIYNAVIEQQSNQIIERLRIIVDDKDLTPTEKLRRYMMALIDILMQTPSRPESYRRLLIGEGRKVSRIFRAALDKERELFLELLAIGVKEGEFDIRQAQRLPALVNWVISASYFEQKSDSLNHPNATMYENLEKIIDFVTVGISCPTADKRITT